MPLLLQLGNPILHPPNSPLEILHPSLHILDPVSLESRGGLPVEAGYGDMTVAADGSVWLVRSEATTVLHITPRPL